MTPCAFAPTIAWWAATMLLGISAMVLYAKAFLWAYTKTSRRLVTFVLGFVLMIAIAGATAIVAVLPTVGVCPW